MQVDTLIIKNIGIKGQFMILVLTNHFQCPISIIFQSYILKDIFKLSEKINKQKGNGKKISSLHNFIPKFARFVSSEDIMFRRYTCERIRKHLQKLMKKGNRGRLATAVRDIVRPDSSDPGGILMQISKKSFHQIVTEVLIISNCI